MTNSLDDNKNLKKKNTKHKNINNSSEIFVEDNISKAKVQVLVANTKLGGILVEKFNILDGYVNIHECERSIVIKNYKIVSNTLIVEGNILSDIQYSTPKNYLRSIKKKTSFQFATVIEDFINEKESYIELYNYNVKVIDSCYEKSKDESFYKILIQQILLELNFNIYEKKYIKVNVI